MSLTTLPSDNKFVPLIEANKTISFENDTIDVYRKGCFGEFNTVACIRNGVLGALASITALLCLLKILRLHWVHHTTWHQYVIFYGAFAECIIGSVHWVMGRLLQLDFVLQYLQLVQFLVLCHWYWALASRALRKETLLRRCLVPLLALLGIYFTVIAILGIIHIQPSWTECMQPYWLELSVVTVLLVQLLVVSGIFITRRLNEISTLDSLRWSQKRDLWCLIAVFETSACVTLFYDLAVQILGDNQSGCSGVFLHTQELFSPIFLSFMVLKLLLPIWVMLFVFHPLPPAGDQEDLIPAFSEDGAYSSTFSASTEDQQYRQLYYPAEDYRSVDTQVSVAPGGHLTGAVGTNIKITHSAATNVATNANYFKQTSLAPIREESGSASAGSLTAMQGHSINSAPISATQVQVQQQPVQQHPSAQQPQQQQRGGKVFL